MMTELVDSIRKFESGFKMTMVCDAVAADAHNAKQAAAAQARRGRGDANM